MPGEGAGTTEPPAEEPIETPQDPAPDSPAPEERARVDITTQGAPADGGQADAVQPLSGGDFTLDIAGLMLANGNSSNPLYHSSGSQVTATVNFTVDGASQLETGRLRFRLRVPEGLGLTCPSSTNYNLQKGAADDVFAPGVSDDGEEKYDYYWLVWTGPISMGSASSFTLNLTPFQPGVTAHNAACDIDIQGYDLKDSAQPPVALPGAQAKKTAKYIAITDTFGWSAVSVNSGWVHNTAGNPVVPGYTYKFTATNLVARGTLGSAHTEKVTFESSVEVPTNPSGTPLILIEEGNLYDDGGRLLVKDVDYKVDATKTVDGKSYITKFTLMKTVQNTDPAAGDLANAAMSLRLAGAQYNETAIMALMPNTDIGTHTDFNFKVTSKTGKNTATPAYALEGTGKRDVGLAVTENVQWPYRYTIHGETGSETNNGNTFKKTIVNIGSTNTNGTDPGLLSAYGGNMVYFELGRGFVNRQKGPLDELVFEDRAATDGTCFIPTEIAPRVVKLGSYSLAGDTAEVKVVVQYTSGGDTTYSELIKDLPANKEVSVDDTREVKSVKITYTDVGAGFRIDTPPQIGYEVQYQPDDRHGDRFENTATMGYTYKGEEASPRQSSTAGFTYKVKLGDLDGRYSSNKRGENLSNPGQYPKVGDVLQFTATYTNNSGLPVPLDLDGYTLRDTHSENLSFYGEDTLPGGDPLPADVASDLFSNVRIAAPSSEQGHILSAAEIDPSTMGITLGKFDDTEAPPSRMNCSWRTARAWKSPTPCR